MKLMDKDDKSRVGQGELYSPSHATKLSTKLETHNQTDESSIDLCQGELYSPAYAVKVSSEEVENRGENSLKTAVGVVEATKEAAMDVKRNLEGVKDKILEKLGAHAPADKMENVRQFLESVVKEVSNATGAARGVTAEVLHRVKAKLGDMLPNLSPDISKKMVDEIEKEYLPMKMVADTKLKEITSNKDMEENHRGFENIDF